MIKLFKKYKKILIRSFALSLSLVVFASVFCISSLAATKKISVTNSDTDGFQIYYYSQNSGELCPVRTTVTSGTSDGGFTVAYGTIPKGEVVCYYDLSKYSGISASAGDDINFHIPLYFNNDGVYSDGSYIKPNLDILNIGFRKKDGSSYYVEILNPIGSFTDVRYGKFPIDITINLDYDISGVTYFSFATSSNKPYYQTTWGASGMRALFGFYDDIVLTTGDDIPKYTAPDDTSVNQHNNLENSIKNANTEGLNNTGALFQGIGNTVNSNSSIGKGLLAVTKIFTNFSDIPFLKDLIMFSLILGMFAFLVGMSSLITGAHRNHVQKQNKSKGKGS